MTRILLVDDEPRLLCALTITLRARDYDADTASYGSRALTAAASRPPHLVVLDLGLPDIDGVEVIRRLRSWTSVPIIVLSGRCDSAQKAPPSTPAPTTTSPSRCTPSGVGSPSRGSGSKPPGGGGHPGLVLPVAAAVTVGTWLAARRSWDAVRDDPFAGFQCLRGRTGTVLDARGCHGHAVIAGQLWAITTTGRPLRAGGQVEVISAADDHLTVAPTRRLPR